MVALTGKVLGLQKAMQMEMEAREMNVNELKRGQTEMQEKVRKRRVSNLKVARADTFAVDTAVGNDWTLCCAQLTRHTQQMSQVDIWARELDQRQVPLR